MPDLTPKQERFVAEYLVDLNATQAALRSGYSPRTAHKIGSENLHKPAVIEAIAAAQASRAERAELTADMVVSELRALGFSNMRDYVDEDGALRPLHELTREQSAAISELTVTDVVVVRGEQSTVVSRKTKLKLAAKREPLVDLGKHLGLWNGEGPETSHVTFIVNFAPRRQSRRLSYVDQEREAEED